MTEEILIFSSVSIRDEACLYVIRMSYVRKPVETVKNNT
jgi:hypothetical protein